MSLEDKKQSLLNAIKSSSNLSVNIKKKFQEQVFNMNNEEFEAFLKSIREVESEGNLDNKISQVKDQEEESHAAFLKIANDSLKNLLQERFKKQKEVDKSKADDLLNKMKSS